MLNTHQVTQTFVREKEMRIKSIKKSMHNKIQSRICCFAWARSVSVETFLIDMNEREKEWEWERMPEIPAFLHEYKNTTRLNWPWICIIKYKVNNNINKYDAHMLTNTNNSCITYLLQCCAPWAQIRKHYTNTTIKLDKMNVIILCKW